jgi:uncharacterized RDD family membrane protein YckC
VTTNLWFTGLLLPGVLFSLLYFPVLRMSLVLVSPYPKANLGKRIYGAAIDGLLVSSCLIAFWNAGSVPFAVAGLLYLLLRDAFNGQSLGKFFVGQVVIQVDTGERCGLAGSITRNLLLVLPGANLVAVFLEARTLVRDRQGQRLGDRLARTQVIEGLGAPDVVKDLQRWWASFLAELPGHSASPRARPWRRPGATRDTQASGWPAGRPRSGSRRRPPASADPRG